MSNRDAENKRFYDLVYDAWLRGRNSDAVSIDRFDDRLIEGYPPEEITLNMIYPRRPKEDDGELVEER